MKKARIIVVGSYVTDLTFRSFALPQPGETIKSHAFRVGHGGKGANQAVAAARLGARVDMVCALGNDANGQEALANFRNEGIGTSHITFVDGVATGAAGIVVNAEGENQIVIFPGANDQLSVDHVLQAYDHISAAKLLLLQFEVPLKVNIEAARLAKKLGLTVVVNPAPAADPGELLNYTDILTPNETEAASLTKCPITSVEDALKAAKLLAAKVPNVVITMGKHGAVYAGISGEGRVPAITTQVVDTTGAGDSFNGALAVAIAEGLTLPQAIRFANQCAAISVTREGTSPAMPYRREIIEEDTQ